MNNTNQRQNISYGDCGSRFYIHRSYRFCQGKTMCMGCQEKAMQQQKEHRSPALEGILEQGQAEIKDIQAKLTSYVIPDMPTMDELDHFTERLNVIKDHVIQPVTLLYEYTALKEHPIPTTDLVNDLVKSHIEADMKIIKWRDFVGNHMAGEKYAKLDKVVQDLVTVDRSLTAFEIDLIKSFGYHDMYEQRLTQLREVTVRFKDEYMSSDLGVPERTFPLEDDLVDTIPVVDAPEVHFEYLGVPVSFSDHDGPVRGETMVTVKPLGGVGPTTDEADEAAVAPTSDDDHRDTTDVMHGDVYEMI